MSSKSEAQLAEIVRAFGPWRQLHRLDAWRPLTEEGAGGETLSRFGGVPLLKSGEAWPHCGGCGRPMQLFLQLDLSTLPRSSPFRDDRGLLQLFYCVEDPGRSDLDDCNLPKWEPFSAGKLARVIEIDPSDGASPTIPDGLVPFPCRRITGWERLDDYPAAAEQEELGLTYEYDFQARPYLTTVEWGEGGVRFERVPESGIAEAISTAAEKDKLGGWPMWVQGVEYPTCPKCDRPMTYFFQIDSEDHVPFMFGDVGCGHLTRCERHPDILGFGWACS